MTTLLALAVVSLSVAGTPDSLSVEQVRDQTLRPYEGPSAAGVDRSTLTKKILCGYQGWFNAQGDGAGRGWVHWSRGRPPAAGTLTVDLWPDTSELSPEERFPTSLRHADGRVAEVFSSFNRATVLRHFDWMRQAAIDGVFVQRFPVSLRDPRGLRHNNTVLAHCREGANRFGCAYALMYDLSGMKAGQIGSVIDDWRLLHARMRLGEDPAYLRHRGRPVVAVWGVGFNDKRQYTLDECRQLVEFLRSDREHGGCCVMLGVPFQWRLLRADSVSDPALHDLLKKADIVSPWSVGRYRAPRQATEELPEHWRQDLAWCRRHGLDYLPVAFPGFSWHNLHGGPLDQIPRLKGEFLWQQFVGMKRAGAEMIYVAMFDEVDEGTAIFKCTNDLPTSDGVQLLGFEGLPSDFYLKLVGRGGKLLRE